MKYHTLFLLKLGKMSQNLLSAAVVIGALRVNVRVFGSIFNGLISCRGEVASRGCESVIRFGSWIQTVCEGYQQKTFKSPSCCPASQE